MFIAPPIIITVTTEAISSIVFGCLHTIFDVFSMVFLRERRLELDLTTTFFLLSNMYRTAACSVIVIMNVYPIPIAHRIPKSLIGGILAVRKERNATIVVIVARNIAIPTSCMDDTIASPHDFPFSSSAL